MRTRPIVTITLALTFALFGASLTLPGRGQAQTPSAPDPLQPLHFLVGRWRGAGKSDAGAIQGATTFEKELQGRVLVRRDRSTFPNSTFPKQGARSKPEETKPYEQMMVIAPEPSGGTFTADYWDSAGHVIAYIGTVTRGGRASQVQFLSVPAANAPHFRLTYTAVGSSRLHTVFEMEPPGGTAWHTIAEGDSVKVH